MFKLEKELIAKLNNTNNYVVNHLYITQYIVNSMFHIPHFIMIITFAIASLVVSYTLDNMIPLIVALPLWLWLIGNSCFNYYAIHLMKIQKNPPDVLFDKIRNLWLINNKVVSFGTWRNIKKYSKEVFDILRCEKSYNTCYHSTFLIANIAKQKDIILIWFLNCERDTNKFGHAVLAKNEYIYDSNMRRTYHRDKYLEACKAKVFKEFSFDEYLVNSSLKQLDPFTHFSAEWDEFKVFCEFNGGFRCIQDH